MMMMIPDREASTRALRTYWVTRLVIILEFVLSTTAACLEMLQTALGIDVAAWSRYDAKYGNQHSDDDDDDDDKNNNFLAEKARLVEQCLCFREKKAGRRRISPTGEAEASLTAGGGDSSDSVGNSAIDLWELRELALSKGGLVKARYRQQAWPRLVGLTEEDIPELADDTNSGQEEDEEKVGLFVGAPLVLDELSTRSVSFKHGSASCRLGVVVEEQLGEEKKSENIDASVDMIRRDAGRSVVFRYNLLGNDQSNGEEDGADDATTYSAATAYSVTPLYASQRLAKVLEDTIREGNSSWHYYQGLHDIAGVILHNMNYQTRPATLILKRISRSHLRDAMRENFGNITWLLTVVLPPLVEKVEPHVHYALQLAQVDLANFVLPWMITWFTHDLHDPETAGRLVDAFLSGHPLMPMYFAVALITHPIFKQDLLQADSDDQGSIFLLIKRMPLALRRVEAVDHSAEQEQCPASVSLQEVLEDSLSIMNRVPPRSLLDLVSSESYSRSELLQRASSISLFKAPASWSMAYGSMAPFVTGVARLDTNESAHVRAKLASGVPMLIATVCNSSILENASWGSRKYIPTKKKKKSTKMRRFVQVLLGKKK